MTHVTPYRDSPMDKIEVRGSDEGLRNLWRDLGNEYREGEDFVVNTALIGTLIIQICSDREWIRDKMKHAIKWFCRGAGLTQQERS